MRIVHALGWYFPETVGGTEIYVAGLSRLQHASGHEVVVVAPDPSSSAVRSYEHDGVAVFRYPIPAVATRDEAQAVVPARGAEHLAAYLERHRPDIFHVHSIVTGLGRHEIARAKRVGARTILTHHLPGLGHVCRRGTLLEYGATPCDGHAAPRRCAACVLAAHGLGSAAGLAAAVPLLVSRAASQIPGRFGTALALPASIERDADHQRELNEACGAIVVLNDAARRILLANGTPAGKMIVNRLGHGHVVVPHRSTRVTARPVRFGFLGRLHPTKGVFELVRAARSVPTDAGFTLDIRGVAATELERRVLAELQALAAGERRIRFDAPVAPGEVLETVAAFDVLCCPSIWFENGPTIAIEAIAAGTPVLGTRFGNLAELVADGVNGRLVPPADERALAAALEEIARRPEIVNTWRSALPPARTMNDVALAYEELYANLHRRDAA